MSATWDGWGWNDPRWRVPDAAGAGLRRVANLVNLSTPLGLLIAGAGGAKFRLGPAGLILADGYRWPFPVASAFTIGDVLITGRLWEDLLHANPRLLQHEARHSWQYVIWLGLPMLPAYGLAMAWSWLRTGDRWSANLFEQTAGLSDGGYLERPRRRRSTRLRSGRLRSRRLRSGDQRAE